MHDVFISYAREDRLRAEQVARGLSTLGLNAFWDTDIPPGQTWADYIEGKLAQCKAVVVLWSEYSTKSQWVREEARMGREKAKLIPARFDAFAPPFGFGEVQAADLSTWHGETTHPEWVRFSHAVFAAARGAETAIPNVEQPQWQPPPQQQHSPWQTPQPVIAGGAWAGAATLPPAQAQSPVAFMQKSLRMYVNGAGRSRRKELGWFIALYLISVVIAAIGDAQTSGLNAMTGAANSYMFVSLVWLAFICPFVSLMSRRAHDIGQSGWVAALAAVPVVGAVMALVFVCIPGQPGSNQYGPDPKAGAVSFV